ncbi:MAG: hypothetical protein IKY69_02550, partial [Bacteroidaceae bacterium]|nr:hypothetical protein [Bacteroidaceae bacterium]
ATPYAEFMANGYFFNEVKGELSNGTLTLRALVDLENNTTTNVNILTHLKYSRIKNLVTSGKTFDKANAQAQKELLTAFGLSNFCDKEVSSFSIIAGTDESAALIAISSLLLMERSEAAFTEYLSKLSTDFGKNGSFSQENKKQIEADKKELAEKLDDIKENIVERYESLGIDVKVKNLAYFVDWNNDGQAGNEILKEGEKVNIENSVIEVPNEGGTYNIKIESPIQLFLKSKEQPDTLIIVSPSTSTNVYINIYEGYDETDKEIGYEKSFDGNILNIKVSALQSLNDKSKSINLYDCMGNIAATITINQKGKKPDGTPSQTPLLSTDGQLFVANIAMQITEALKDYNIIEQYYNSNTTTNNVKRFVSPHSNQISSLWSKCYKANNYILTLKNIDETRLNVYGDYCNVLSAIYYSNLVYGWGGVPYLSDYSQIESPLIDGYPRVPAGKIFEDLKNKLSSAIDNLHEKKNESLKSINGFFFTSKDVARVLLANIHMYEGNYKGAQPLLEKVIENGFYSLDANADYNLSQNNAAASKEVIFAFVNSSEAQSDGTITEAKIIPYITLSDIYLSLAECHCMNGNTTTAEEYIQTVAEAKKLNTTESNIIMKIKEIREQILLHSGTYFAFLKRTGIAKDVCGIEEYQLLFPIPANEIIFNNNMTQNPGY